MRRRRRAQPPADGHRRQGRHCGHTHDEENQTLHECSLSRDSPSYDCAAASSAADIFPVSTTTQRRTDAAMMITEQTSMTVIAIEST